MKNLLKKNQLMITALAIMIAIAGYLQFAGNNIEEEYLTVGDEISEEPMSAVDSSTVFTENYTASDLDDEYLEIQSLDTDLDVYVDNYLEDDYATTIDDIETAQVMPDEGEIPGEAVLTSAGFGTGVLSDAKLLKEQTRAKNKETLLDIINSAGLSEEQKQSAVQSMVEMTEISEKEAAAEILLEAKGFMDVVVSINENNVDVVVNAVKLSDAQRAQIEDIVTRKTGVNAENIIISTVVQ